MRVVIFGATGLIGQGALAACLADPDVKDVVIIVRREMPEQPAKVSQIVHANLNDLEMIEPMLRDLDACFYCLGVSAAGLTEEEYKHVTYDLAMEAAQTLVKLNPGMSFIFVSGAGTDSTEKSNTMWARVKGMTENAILALPFKSAYAFRPGLVRPVQGAVSRTSSYRIMHAVLWPFFPLLERLFPNHVTTSSKVGRAMLAAVRGRALTHVLENAAINALSES